MKTQEPRARDSEMTRESKETNMKEQLKLKHLPPINAVFRGSIVLLLILSLSLSA